VCVEHFCRGEPERHGDGVVTDGAGDDDRTAARPP
jgi:hypothetical protein